MLKIIKIYSVVALATLVMIGCGASDDGGKSPEKKPPRRKISLNSSKTDSH